MSPAVARPGFRGFFFQAEDGIRDFCLSRGLGDVYKRQVCTNQLPYIWNGNPYNTAGQYTDTLISTTAGCDTIAVLNLAITAMIRDTTNATVCTNQLPYIWNGNPYNTAGQYTDTLISTTGGCDTIAVLNLAITALIRDTTNATVCTNQLPYIWNGNPYNTAGQYIDTLISTTGGCDTIAVLNLSITAMIRDTTNATCLLYTSDAADE